MLTHLKRNAIAYTALFLALGGTSYAAVRLPAGPTRSSGPSPSATAPRTSARSRSAP